MALYRPGTGETDPYKINLSLQGIATAVDANTIDLTTLKAAWTTYTPTLTAFTGTYTSASAAGTYLQIGKTVFINIVVTITTNGTAAGSAVATLPVNAKSLNYVFQGRENQVTGNGLIGSLNTVSQMFIQKYDGTYLGANGYVLAISGVYEAA